MKIYEYDPICTRAYDGLYCDGPCKICDEHASDKAAEADYNREEHAAWLASTPGVANAQA